LPCEARDKIVNGPWAIGKIAIREDKISAVSRAINQRLQYQAAI
jgi:hypothetical protein